MSKRQIQKTRDRKAKQKELRQAKRSAPATSEPASKAPSRRGAFFSSTANLARRHLAIIYVIGACLLVGLVSWGTVAWLTAPEPGPEVGNRAPDFVLQTVDGSSISLRDLRGKIVILDFWQAQPSLCSPSQSSPGGGSQLGGELQAVLDRWPDKKLAILAIAPIADSAEGQELVKELGITFPVGLDPAKETYKNYHLAYDPTRVFIDKRGVIRAIMPGPALSTDEIEATLRSIKRNRKIETTRPLISNVLVLSVADKEAQVEFATDRPAVGWVMTDNPDSASCTAPEATATSNHAITLHNLKPNTTYHFRAFASDQASMESPSLSRAYSFTTLVDTLPPVISGMAVSDITDSSATINWSTDEPAISQVEYGTSANSGQMLKQEEAVTTSHSTSLATLDPDTTYQFTITSTDPSGNKAITSGSFITLSPIISSEPVAVGDPAPDFTLPTLDGKAISLSDYRGKTVLVHFWTIKCRSCRAEMPLIQDFYTKSREDDVVVLAIAFQDSAEEVKAFVISNNISLPVLLDSEGKVDARYQPTVFPYTYFIDGAGMVRNIKEARFDTLDEIEEILESL